MITFFFGYKLLLINVFVRFFLFNNAKPPGRDSSMEKHYSSHGPIPLNIVNGEKFEKNSNYTA